MYKTIKTVLTRKFIFQFVSYFFVGLTAALVEWGIFWAFNVPCNFNIYASTALAFLLATLVNWIIARKTTFKEEAKTKDSRRDAAAVFLVSGIGLFFNMVLMGLFSVRLGIYPLVSKIMSTGIVFLWNFASRKFLIYK